MKRYAYQLPIDTLNPEMSTYIRALAFLSYTQKFHSKGLPTTNSSKDDLMPDGIETDVFVPLSTNT